MLTNLLQTSGEGFVWSVRQVLPERLFAVAPAGLGEWSVSRHIFHMVSYEQNYALPSIRQWLAGTHPAAEEFDEEAAWARANTQIETLLAAFERMRVEQLTLLPQDSDSAWQENRETLWGTVTLAWVVGKTYQHTCEHISDVLRISLFWDHFAGRST